MGALGMLTRGIVHDLNNMLTGILGRASILKKKMPADSDLQKDVDIIARSGEQVSELISRIHQFSRQRLDREKPVCLNQVVNQTLDLLRPNLQGIRVTVQGSPQDLWVVMDQTKISQILVNLVVNAKYAVREVEQPELRIDLDDLDISGHGRVMDGDYARLRVADNGSGIAREHLEKIFAPFFTTKTSEHGTGIGLSTVQTLVNEASGAIEVDSLVGKGTVFTILLPRKTPPATVFTECGDKADPAGPMLPRAVLLIDDEAVVRDIGAEMLETLGIKAFTALDGPDGLRVFEARKDLIDLILLDVEMPGMGGEATFGRLREAGCRCPIVIASGYNRDYLERQVFTRRLEYYLAKPFQITQLNTLFKDMAKTGVLFGHGGIHAS
jgi:CheY-like chemotaxis protein/two-component sensor histidine kinase